MSEVEYTHPHWDKDIKTAKVEGEWQHTFDAGGYEVKMSSPNGGGFSVSIEHGDVSVSGNHWYGDSDRLPGEVCFSVYVHTIDEDRLVEAKSTFDSVETQYFDIEQRLEEFDEEDESTWPTKEEYKWLYERTTIEHYKENLGHESESTRSEEAKE